MAFNGNGNWISDFSAVADRDANIKILASRFDNIFIADMAQSFENCLTKDMQVKPQQAFDANSYKVINVANPTNNNDAVNKYTLDSTLDTTLRAIYPVGSLYIGTQNTCPMGSLITGSTWELVAKDKALWTGDGTNGNTTIEAGLPNITGDIMPTSAYSGVVANGACYATTRSGGTVTSAGASGNTSIIGIDASKSSAIYGNSDTVQPDAYVVNVWRRTA